jgi:DNA-binding response OmpR family regulator
MSNPKPLILLVEDDQDLRETIVESLAIHGLPVTGVGSGMEFYQTLNRQSFAVAIVDLGLPDLNGYDLVAYLRENTNLKIIILTARTALADRVKGYSTGADLYLVKPVDIEELAAAILSIVARTAPPQSTAAKCWLLERTAWRIIAPDGRDFRLSQKEYRILVELAAAKGAPAKKEAILNAAYDETEGPSSRALDVIVSRFRSRYQEQTGCILPLQTVPGVGFLFTATLTVI